MEKWEDIFKKISFLEKEFINKEKDIKSDIRQNTGLDLAKKEMSLEEKEWILEEKEKKLMEEMRRLKDNEKSYFEEMLNEKEQEIQKLKSEKEILRTEFNNDLKAKNDEIELIKSKKSEEVKNIYDEIKRLEKIIEEKDKIIERFKQDFMEVEKNWRATIEKTNNTFVEFREGLHKEIEDIDKRSREKQEMIEKEWLAKLSQERSKYQDIIFKLERKSKRYIRVLKSLYISSKKFGYFYNEANQKFFETITHDINLAISTAYYSLTKISMKSKLRDNFSIISNSIHEAKDYLSILDDFITLKSSQFSTISVGILFSKLQQKYYDIGKKNNIKLLFSAVQDIPEFKGDENLLTECLSYLMDNSFETISNEGEISVIGAFNPELDHITITVNDTGPGIPLESREMSFVPFYTTKKGKKGLGLTKARLIAYLHNGNILMDRKDNYFSVSLVLPAIIDPQEGI